MARSGRSSTAQRPDGRAKVDGAFVYASDLREPGMLWGAVVRSPHPSARIRRVDVVAARAVPGVAAVLTADDIPGVDTYGLITPDQPVFARDVVRFHGEPVAAVAAANLDVARRAAAAVVVEYEPTAPVVDPEAAIAALPVHPDGNVFKHLHIRYGDVGATGDAVVEGTYDWGRQDQAFLGPEAGLAEPTGDGGVRLRVATQALHIDRQQLAACLGLPADQVHLELAGVGGAFGGREDITVQIHASLLALATGAPVMLRYDRRESFLGHVHRHPARMWYCHHATRDGDLVKVEARIVLDGGAYASTSPAVLVNACCFAVGPYRVDAAVVEGYAVRTNNPPSGAMRGFGCPQTCFGHESQMDRLAAALDLDPVQLRLRNALASGDQLITGQRITGTAPVREVIAAATAHPLPPELDDKASPLDLPGGAGLTGDRSHVRRGIALAVGFKNLAYSEGYDDYSTAAVRLERDAAGRARATVHCAAAECGQGFVTLAQQLVRDELGVEQVDLHVADTAIGSAGSSSASRQTVVSGGAVVVAARAVRAAVVRRMVSRHGLDPSLAPSAPSAPSTEGDGVVATTPDALEEALSPFELVDERVIGAEGGPQVDLADLLDEPIEQVRVYRHDPTEPLDRAGQGDAHVAFMFAAHRAVVDVDPELGQVRVVQLATGHDIGRVLHPVQALGQVEGGVVQGIGMALLEDLRTENGAVVNADFADYLLPTALDAPDVPTAFVEQPEPRVANGAKGLGEMPSVPSTAAVAAAVRAATRIDLRRVPIRPADIALGAEPPADAG